MITSYKKAGVILTGCVVLIFCSCRKNLSVKQETTATSFVEVFDAFWNNMNINYVFWDIDTTNWDEMYQQYRPLFAQLNLNSNTDIRKSVQYFRQMTSGLTDNHYYIDFTRAAISDSSIYPALARKLRSPGFHNPYPYVRIDSNYLDDNFVIGINNSISFNGRPLTVMYGTINNTVLYFTFNHFHLAQAYQSGNNSVKSALNGFFDILKNLPATIKGIIIDVRGNPGGNVSDLNFLMGRFIDKPLHIGYTQYKSGNGRLDYTPWIPSYVNPVAGSKAISQPIVVLADNTSASMSELVVMAVSALPNSVFVGETTWGATGPLTNPELYNDGQFTIENFLHAQTSSARFKYLDNKLYEGTGFPADIPVAYNADSLARGKDIQLEKAISLIK